MLERSQSYQQMESLSKGINNLKTNKINTQNVKTVDIDININIKDCAVHQNVIQRTKRTFGKDLTNKLDLQKTRTEPAQSTKIIVVKEKKSASVKKIKKKIFISAPSNPSWFERNSLHQSYLLDIVSNLRKKEIEQKDTYSLNYFSTIQKDITPKMRSMLMNWLYKFSLRFETDFNPITYVLCIKILDTYLSKVNINRKNFQQIGLTCLWIASKYNEVYAESPLLTEYLFISRNEFKVNDMIKMEQSILFQLDFKLGFVSPLTFIEYSSFITDYYTLNKYKKQLMRDLMEYLCQICVLEYSISLNLPSKIAAAVFVFSIFGTKMLTKKEYRKNIKQFIKFDYDDKDVKTIVKALYKVLNKPKYILSAYPTTYKIYADKKKSRVSRINFKKWTF
jgi:hypothetical protein